MKTELTPGAGDETLNGLEWLRVESVRLMDEDSDPEYGICGNEWLIVEQLQDAEEANASAEMLNALRDCECPQIAEMAKSMLGAS